MNNRLMNYFWIRIFDYKEDTELKEDMSQYDWNNQKGTLLDEYYLCGEDLKRESVKEKVKERSNVERFAKPRKNNSGVYALIMDSNEFFYNRFTKEVDCICFNCHKAIKGKEKDFPSMTHYPDSEKGEDKYYFCSWECYREVSQKVNPYNEGDWQQRENYETNGGVYGYIDHIYNRKTNMHYIGQTVYMPFFRWQEHARQHIKGDLVDLTFETITEVRVKSQEYLNNIEAWWIRKFIHDYGKENVMNLTVPKITMSDLVRDYKNIIEGQQSLSNLMLKESE